VSPDAARVAASGGTCGLRFDPDDELLARTAWSRLAEPGDRRLASLLEQVGPSDALRALLSREADWLATYLPRLPALDPAGDVRWLTRLGGRVVLPGDDEWPPGLASLSAPPVCLWVRGPADLAELGRRSVAVVGARSATPYGERVAAELGAGLAERGFTVVSGLAYGIDGAAHRGALSAGTTVAVVAGGLDRAYPQGHDQLMSRLVEVGAVVSEVPPGSAPTRSRFLERNRVIAAATGGTVVVEAALRSGALNTARTALALGRPVGAVPGAVTSMMSAGCHALVRDERAVLVTDAAEAADLVGRVGDDLAPEQRGGGRPGDDLDAVTRRVLDALPVRRGSPVERVCSVAGLDLASTQSALGRLALLGLAEREGAGWRVLRPPPPASTRLVREALAARRAVREPPPAGSG
jgi:DNA processing protein